MCPSIWWIARKSSTTQSAEIGSTTSAYTTGGIAPSHGPRYGISSATATQAPNRIAYVSKPSGSQPIIPRSHSATPALVPMISETSSCPFT